jgi:pimeloyl-ACP methyl ester carboxylesterase
MIRSLAVYGKEEPVSEAATPEIPELVLEKTVTLSAGLTRGDGVVTTIELGDEHLVELVYEDGTRWLASPSALEELYPGMATQQRGGETAMLLPVSLDRGATPGFQPALTRGGILETVALKVLNLFTRKAAAKGMAWLAADLEEKQLGSQRGLMRVTARFGLTPMDNHSPLKPGPVLVFIHGTNSSSTGSFAELVNTELWSYIAKRYSDNVLAFQHETLTKSPLQNAVELIRQLPADTELHIVTHSRGGLVGELLARYSVRDIGGGGNAAAGAGFSEKEIAYLQKEGRDKDIGWIRELQAICAERRFSVTKFVRVACPTAGTTLLSNRLDHFFNISLNVIGWTTGASANPAYLAMKSLLTAAIDQKNDPDVLPGLEAMKPDSPFIKVLNNQETIIDRPIVAISGACQAKVSFKALLILAERLFFGADNDLVVNTQSMYAGSQRSIKLQYFFDQGTDVDHFHYFANKRTNAAVQFALQATGADRISGFSEFFRGGPLALTDVQSKTDFLGIQGGQYATGAPSGKRPIVVLLPGILGSCLQKDHALIWINYLRILNGAMTQLAIDDTGIEATSLVETSYKELGDWLSTDYDVVTFPTDWRLSPETAAGLLEQKIKELLPLGQPVRLIAHSLGGVIVRDLMVFYPDTWKLLNASTGFRLLFLGAPLRGCFRIVNVLLGKDEIIDKISALDLLHTKTELLLVFNTFPGILALLPLGLGAERVDFWDTLGAALGNAGVSESRPVDAAWPAPRPADLEVFRVYQDRVLAVMDLPGGLDLGNAVYIAGQYPHTPCSYRIDVYDHREELVLLSTAAGDQSVTWESGIPPVMTAANNVYYVNHSHGELANSPDMFAGIRELLERGRTNLLSQNVPKVRGEERLFRQPATTNFDLSVEGVRNTLLGIGSATNPTASELPLKAAVTHGDVKYSRYPVLVGHFSYDSILYAEKRIDQLLVGQLEERHRLGIYPGAIGTSDIVLTYAEDSFPGTIIIGLGEPDKLTGYDLSVSVEQAVVKYLLLVNGRDKPSSGLRFKDPIGISSLLIGCGYGGLSIETVVLSILQGVTNANTRIAALYAETSRLVTEVEFIELYQDRALGCYYAVRRAGIDSGGALKIIATAEPIAERYGARQKVNIDQGRDWWNRITVTMDTEKNAINYSLTTSAAREEQEELYTVGGVVDNLIESISTNNQWSEDKASAIFELLIPNNFKQRLKQHGNITWVLDKFTAGYPWELLQHKGPGVKPLCINAGMIRTLATGDSRINIEGVAGNAALVIGDPQLGGFLPQLPGAFEEAKAVSEELKDRYQLQVLLQAQQDAIVSALMSGSYKIIHLAGHGLFDPDPTKPSGMVIGKESFLGTKQIAQMSATPDLVFVNCCYLGKIVGAAEQFYQSRYKLAANIGTQLIENGVKAVIVAGWAVEDVSARLFATTFYGGMLAGIPFGEAVRQAREAVYNADNRYNTWGAYQCYGNPWYRLRDTGGTADSTDYVITEQAATDLANLASDMRMGDLTDQQVLDRLDVISKAVDRCNIRTPAITELEARIYKGMGNYGEALAKYKEMMASTTGGYPFSAVEQYCNLRAKLLKNRQEKGEPVEVLDAEYTSLVNELEALILLSRTDERYNILASTWKRRCSLYGADPQKLKQAIRQSADGYREAYGINPTAYAYTNWISMERLLEAAGLQEWGGAAAAGAVPGVAGPVLPGLPDVLAVIKQLKQACALRQTTDFWEMVVPANLQLTYWLLTVTRDNDVVTGKGLAEVVEGYRHVWARAGSTGDRLVEVQHLLLLGNALNGLSPGHWLAGWILKAAEALR